jgi:hypothetical protein
VDAGWREVDVVQDGLTRFPKGMRAKLSLVDYVHVLMAEGVVWVNEEHMERALENFGLVLSLKEEVPDLRILALAHFWSSRCHRKIGEYDNALIHAGAGHQFATLAGMEPMAAAMRVAESWLLFQKGRTKDALKLLAEAGAAAFCAGDYGIRQARRGASQPGAVAGEYGVCGAADGAAVEEAHRCGCCAAPEEPAGAAPRIRGDGRAGAGASGPGDGDL